MQSIAAIPALPKRGQTRKLVQLPGDSDGLTIARLAAESGRLTVVITADTAAAERLKETTRFFSVPGPADRGVSSEHDTVLHFPDRETLPYDNFSPHQDITSERLRSLYQLPQRSSGILIIPIAALMHRLPPREYVLRNSLQLACGDALPPEQLNQQLSQAGYRRVDTVMEHGEFAMRGSLVDLYPMGTQWPLRIEFFDDDIESLRTFDPETQRSVDKVQQFSLLPAREMPLNAASIKLFKAQWHSRFTVDHQLCPTYRDVADALAPPGIEYYLPLFFEQTVLLTSYLPDDCLLVMDQGARQAAESFWRDVCNRYDDLNIDPRRPLLPPKELFATSEEIFAELRPHPRFDLLREAPDSSARHVDPLPFQPAPEVAADPRRQSPWARLQQFSQRWHGRILFTAESAGRREALLEALQPLALRPVTLPDWPAFLRDDAALGIAVAPLSAGFLIGDDIAVIPESELFGGRVSQQQRRESKTRDGADAIIRNLAELTLGAAVVHIDHGVGRYLGLQCLDVDGAPMEFLLLEYADQAKLYVPVASLHLINRYTGVADDMAPLHRLGSDSWQRERDKAARQIRDTAAELLEIYARRAAREGEALAVDANDYRRFAAEFPFEETVDQQAAIAAVEDDMARATPMDRLVCGDVGFGKTEVAMRAAFIAVQNERQVAVLVPTTLLAQQHYDTFRDRFADWPFNIEQMSRFRSAKQQTQARQRLAQGKADIVIGTHKLLQGDIAYQQLGLLIIDEEHRFGVRQKERLKALRAEVDILTLTATPIPRTLNMSLAGMRDLSIIATPPAKRLAIRTFVRERDNAVIKEALLRELLRGGQVYFVHNDVASIERCARELGELVPQARIAIGHGQMRERELEQVMSDFHHKRYNILVCTTIIETGIDIPSANTMIIERADKFGLAQLHQLRGRVGRSHHQAYAYLLTPHSKAMTVDAGKRLEAIAEAQELGAGFVLATLDLEIRGTGELLGEEQSGHIQKIGFTLYMDMLERAVNALKAGKQISTRSTDIHDSQVNLNVAVIIPDDYLPDVHTRLTLYKRIANAANEQALRELQVEMIDRFGLLPEYTKQLFRVTEIKLRCEPLGIAKLDANAQGGKLLFAQDTPVDPLTLVKLVQSQPACYRLEAGNQLRFEQSLADAATRITFIGALLEQLQPQAA